MDAVGRRPQLPSLGFLEADTSKREEDAYQTRNTGAPQSLPIAAVASPTYQHPSGPPPPYSHPSLPVPQQQHANSVSGVRMGVQTPPESRRHSGDEKDAVKQAARQSLPSISEALGVDNQAAYHTSLPAQPPTSAPSSQARTTAPASPTPSRRSYAMEPPLAPAEHYGSGQQPSFPQYRPAEPAPPAQTYPPSEPSKPAYAEARPPLHVQTSVSPTGRAPPQSSAYAYPPTQASPSFEHRPPQPPATMGPPSSFAYGYTPYPPRYAQPPPPPAAISSAPVYPPSAAHTSPASSAWKSEASPSRYAVDERTYGDSVKRHLDLYDLEAALNDITNTSGIMTDFARRYGDRLHQTARQGPSLATLPSIIEVEDMITKSRLQMDALGKIRDVIIAQQAAYDQQAAEQRNHSNKAYPGASDPHSTSSASVNASAIDNADADAGFAGSDTKKRRGRAAPPGRCHSCNRAETPEWRRGPDGARTLCNACGLHYAKLTRKQNNAAGKAAAAVAAGGSNLRPKE